MPQPASPASAYQCTWDAWNRLVKVQEPNGLGGWRNLAEFQYDGQTWRTIAKAYSGGTLSETRHLYYSSQWQVIEERLGASPSSAAANRQFVWGQRYIDDLVLRDRDTDGIGTLDERLYAMQDSNWNVVALSGTTATIVERLAYQAYGTPLELSAAFAAQPDTKDWELWFAGYRSDAILKLDIARYRSLNGHLGAWVNRDPIGYNGEINLYNYVLNQPLVRIDPFGLQSKASPARPAFKPNVPPGRLPSDYGFAVCCGGILVDPKKSCCVPVTIKESKSKPRVYSNSQNISVQLCARRALVPGGGLGEQIGLLHMWLVSDFAEIGLGEVHGTVPGAGRNSPTPLPLTGVNDHTGQSAAKDAKCITIININACCIARQMVQRATNKRCGPPPLYNCNTFVYDALRSCGMPESRWDEAMIEFQKGALAEPIREWGLFQGGPGSGMFRTW